MNAEQWDTLTNNLVGLYNDFKAVQTAFHTQQSGQWQAQQRKDKLRALSESLTPCDGEISTQTRNFLYDIDLLLPQLQNDNAGVLLIATRATCGPLRRELLRFIESQPEERANVPWARIKAHVERTFLSADENEKLRVAVEELRQNISETLASYNRRFREAVQRAYPDPRMDDAERIVLRQYMRGLRSADLAKKLSLELTDQTLEAAMKHTERIEAGLERYDGLNREVHTEEPMEVANINMPTPSKDSNDLTSTLAKIQKGQEKMAARLTRIESRIPGENRYGGQRKPNDTRPGTARQGQFRNPRPVECFICGGNHYQAGCPQRPPRPRVDGARPSPDTPSEN